MNKEPPARSDRLRRFVAAATLFIFVLVFREHIYAVVDPGAGGRSGQHRTWMYDAKIISAMGFVAGGDQRPQYSTQHYKSDFGGWLERSLFDPSRHLNVGAVAHNIDKGNVIVIIRTALDAFLDAIPLGAPQFTLVAVNFDDAVTPTHRRRIGRMPAINAFYANNLMVGEYGHKIFPLPLGIPTHTDINTIPDSNGDSTEDPLALERRIMAARTQVKLPRLLIIGAPEKDGPEDTYCRSNWGYAIRCQYFRALRGLPDVDMLSRVPFSEYIETVASYAYVLSPPGNGFDCFRTWEALAVGTIPIVHNHSEYDARLFESTDSWVVSSPEEAAMGLAGRLARPKRQIADKLEPWLTLQFWERKLRGRSREVTSVDTASSASLPVYN